MATKSWGQLVAGAACISFVTMAGCVPHQLVGDSSVVSVVRTDDVVHAKSSPETLGSGGHTSDNQTVAPTLNLGNVGAETVDHHCEHGDISSGDDPRSPLVWGIAGLKGYAIDHQVAPNGLEYNALFTLDLNFNLWLWQSAGAYLFSDLQFWGQRATSGVTNPHQGAFDFSKREFDFNIGMAWNYYGNLELRAFGYSFNNLNRGMSPNLPAGYADGFGLENRLYLSTQYSRLGTADYDVARASFVSAGFYPTKDMVDAEGSPFQPGPFVRAYLTYDLLGAQCYVYTDAQLIGRRSCPPELVKFDAGVAARPFPCAPRLELRLGSYEFFDLHNPDLETSFYGQIRFLY
jgi:hypothetical protein